MGKSKTNIISFKELKNTNMILGLIFAFLIFSMSGIPPLAGFFVKLDILFVLLDNFKYYINYIIFIFTVASFFYYLRIIKIIFFEVDKQYSKVMFKGYERLLLVVLLILFLLFYILIVQNSLLVYQKELLSVIC
jgi:NADH-quinone oxidoreductase subunit N